MSEKILIIDDEAKIRDLLKSFLNKKGYDVVLADSVREGINRLVEEKPEIILLDIRMPEMDGIDAIEKIKEIDPKVNIIMATGVVDYDIVKKAIERGASDYIVKPFDLDYLEKTLTTKISIIMKNK